MQTLFVDATAYRRKVRSNEQIRPLTLSGAVWIWLSDLQAAVDSRVSIDARPTQSRLTGMDF